MTSGFAMEPEFMSVLTNAQDTLGSGISAAYSAATPTVVAGFCTPLGPLAVGNMIPAVCETMTTNCTSGLMNAGTHIGLGAATDVTQAGFSAVEGV
jgi:hypothetical protein